VLVTRKFFDAFLRALWVYSYATLVRVFMLLRHTEKSWGGRGKKNVVGEHSKVRC
jgi:hypothetical protein